MLQNYLVVIHPPLPFGPLSERHPASRVLPTPMSLGFPTLGAAIPYFMKIAKKRTHVVSIVRSDDEEVVHQRSWSPQFFRQRRAGLIRQLEATENGTAAAGELSRRIAEYNELLKYT
jgi:hypothetical protein